MGLLHDLFTPISLTLRVNQLIPAPQFLLDMFFSSLPPDLHDTESFAVDIWKDGQKMAPFVNACLPARPQEREQMVTDIITPGYVKKLRDLKGCDLSERFPGEAIGMGMDPAEKVQQVQDNDMRVMDLEIDRREEWMAAKQLTTGIIQLRGDGVHADVDIHFPTSHAIPASVAWSTTTGDAPINDLENAQGLIADKGFTATDLILGRTSWQNFRRNQGVKELLDIRNINGNMLAAALVTTGAVFRGEFNGLRVWTYWAKYIDDVTNLLTPFIPDDMALVGSTGATGVRHYGLIKDLKAPGGAARVRRFAKSYEEDNPSVRYTLVQSAPMPVMHTPDAWVRIDTTP